MVRHSVLALYTTIHYILYYISYSKGARMSVIKVILGSTRPNRFGIQPAEWVMKLSKEYPDATFELVDLKEINLPFLDEPQPPSFGDYTQEHTKQWTKLIAEADGFIIVTAEYNYSIPAALKNAIDFASNEWAHKPVAFVSYGAGAGGARAVEHLRGVSGWLRMYDLREHVVIVNYWNQLDKDGMFQPSEQQTQAAHGVLKSIVFWAKQLKPARQALQK